MVVSFALFIDFASLLLRITTGYARNKCVRRMASAGALSVGVRALLCAATVDAWMLHTATHSAWGSVNVFKLRPSIHRAPWVRSAVLSRLLLHCALLCVTDQLEGSYRDRSVGQEGYDRRVIHCEKRCAGGRSRSSFSIRSRRCTPTLFHCCHCRCGTPTSTEAAAYSPRPRPRPTTGNCDALTAAAGAL